QAEDGIRDGHVTGVQTCALPIFLLVFLRLCVSVADMNRAISRIPVARARSRPARFGTSAAYRISGLRTTRRATSSVSASCGIHRSEERRVGKECRSRWGPYG